MTRKEEPMIGTGSDSGQTAALCLELGACLVFGQATGPKSPSPACQSLPVSAHECPNLEASNCAQLGFLEERRQR